MRSTLAASCQVAVGGMESSGGVGIHAGAGFVLEISVAVSFCYVVVG